MCKIIHWVRRCSRCNSLTQGPFEVHLCTSRERCGHCHKDAPTRWVKSAAAIPPDQCYECVFYLALLCMAPDGDLVHTAPREVEMPQPRAGEAGSA